MRTASRTRRGSLLVLGAAVALVAAETLLRATYEGLVLPRTIVAGNAVGGVGEVELQRRLRDLDPARRTVTFLDGDTPLRVSGRVSGFGLREQATARRVLRAGRTGALGGFGGALVGLIFPHSIDPVVRIDEAAFDAELEALARRVDRESFAGDLEIDAKTLNVRVAPAVPGRELDRVEAATVLRAAFLDGASDIQALPIREQPSTPPGDLATVADAARSYLEQPLRLTGHGNTFLISRRALARGLTVRPLSAGGVELGMRADILDELISRLASRSDREARDSAVSTPAATETLSEKLDIAWAPSQAAITVAPGRSGRTLDRAGAAPALTAAVRAGDHTASVRVLRPAPAISTSAARRVRSLIGTFTTYFVCCEPRVTNIDRMAATVDGAVVAPGAPFSLNDAVGPRTRAKGYVPAPFIADGEIVPSVGGGVSQFSTTLYNAAYFAGLQLDTHQPHSFFIDRYPPGREATLDYPSIDLRWTNDTSAPVVIRSATTATSVSISLYGDNGGRRVRAVSGPRTTSPGEDFALTVERVVRYPDGGVSREPFTTTYDPPPPPS